VRMPIEQATSINHRVNFMADIQELDKAIGAHGMWKSRLKTAVTTGKTDAPVSTIRVDNECAFGKWLYGATLTASDKATADYKAVKDLHAQFHKLAGQVAELATSGKQDDADKLLSGDFTAVSMKLTAAMMAWKKISK
jgi:hypothetical protein